MSITFTSPDAPTTLEVNLSNSNALMALAGLGVTDPDYGGSIKAVDVLERAFEASQAARWGHPLDPVVAFNMGRLTALAASVAYAENADVDAAIINWS